MKKRILSMLVAMAMVITMMPSGMVTAADDAQPAVDYTDYTVITTKEELNAVRNDLSGKYVLGADIVFEAADFESDGAFYRNGSGWEPIGTTSAPFTGVFDGNGHTISGLKMNYKSESNIYAGLFGYVQDGTICGLGLENAQIQVTYSGGMFMRLFVGGILAYAGGENTEIRDCRITGTMTVSMYMNSSIYIGGIVGYGGNVTGCVNECAISTSFSGGSASCIGGIAGQALNISECSNSGNINLRNYGNGAPLLGGIAGEGKKFSNCTNAGNISGYGSKSSVCAGGIAAVSSDGLIDCSNVGTIEITNGSSLYETQVGGIAATSEGLVLNCHNTGSITAPSTEKTIAGGILGTADADISCCSNTGSITATSDGEAYAGGIAGIRSGSKGYEAFSYTERCCNTGSVTAEAVGRTYCGGIFGYLCDGLIQECYNLGDVEAASFNSESYLYLGGISGAGGYIVESYQYCSVSLGVNNLATSYVGGIVGRMDTYDAVQDCYYRNTVTVGVGYGTDYGVCCTDEQMKQQETYVGFDFNNVWIMGDGTPELRAFHSEEPAFAGGTGTAEDPYLIETKEQLYAVRHDSTAAYRLAADIIFTDADFAEGGDFYSNGAGWEPIPVFSGSFDGDGHQIAGLTVTISTDVFTFAGLFGRVYDSEIRNLTMTDADISAEVIGSNGVSVGAVAGYTDNTVIENCRVSGTVSGSNDVESSNSYCYVGGITGKSDYGACSDCHNTAQVTGKGTNASGYSCNVNGGGITGYQYFGTISDCDNTAAITVIPDDSPCYGYAGGIVGESLGTIQSCYNSGAIVAENISQTRGDASAYAGGIVGYGEDILGCCNVVPITAKSTGGACAGGIAGNADSITDCCNTGEVVAEAYEIAHDYSRLGATAGGIAGNAKALANCYNTAPVTGTAIGNTEKGTSVSVGGIAGGVSGNYEVSCCYNTGSVTGNAENRYIYSTGNNTARGGGIAGGGSYTTFTNCYNAGDVSVTASGKAGFDYEVVATVGGIIGATSRNTVTNCYNIGNLSANGTTLQFNGRAYTGGVVGNMDSNTTVSECYNVGTAIAEGTHTSVFGGVAGKVASNGKVTNCYYLDTVSKGIGSGSGTTTACNEEAMKLQETFVGFDFDAVWTMGGNESYLYPELQGIAMVDLYTLGDVNDDGKINLKDVNLIVSYYNGNAELTNIQHKAADVNGDGKINLKDVNMIVSYYNGNINVFPVE